MSLWQFKRKEPHAPLEINKNAYLSVLLGSGPRPPVLSWMNPDGSNGAVQGFAAPLDQGASPDLLTQPIANGSYALATPDRKTLIQADLFDLVDVPEFRLPTNPTAQAMVDLIDVRLERAERATGLATLVMKGYSPNVYESIRFMLDSAARLADQTDGVVADPLAETYRLPTELAQSSPLSPKIDFRDIGTVKAIQERGDIWVSTRGMSKFNLSEYEVYGVATDDVIRVGELLIVTAQEALLGSPVPIDETVDTPFGRLATKLGTRNRAQWGSRQTIELILA